MKRLLYGIIICLIILGLCNTAQAEWWKNKALQEKLQLTEEQIQTMNQILTESLAKRNAGSADGQSLSKQLTALLAQDILDEEAVEQAILDLVENNKQIAEESLRMKLAVRKVLTQEQVSQLAKEYPNLFSPSRRWITTRKQPAPRRQGTVKIEKAPQQ